MTKRTVLTEAGIKAMQDSNEIKQGIEAEYGRLVGCDDIEVPTLALVKFIGSVDQAF